LRSTGCTPIEVPSILLSNHPGQGRIAGQTIDPALIKEILQTLEANGWLAEVSAVLSGYLPTPAHVDAMRAAVEHVKRLNPAAIYVCDPILGDDPRGLYIAEAAACAIRDTLLPLADVATPNRFELSWLSGRPVHSVHEAEAAASLVRAPVLVATSIPEGKDRLATLCFAQGTRTSRSLERKPRVAHGTGDLLAALFTGHLAQGCDAATAFSHAHAALETVIARSGSFDLLALSPLTTAAAAP